jgi:TolB protein
MRQARIVSAVTLVGTALLLAPALPFAAPDFLSVASTALQQQQQQPPREVSISIRGRGANRLPRLGIPNLIVNGDAETGTAARTIGEVLWNDLEFEREFALIARDAAAKIPASPVETLPYEAWNELGADYVLVASATRADAALTVDVRIMGVEQRAAGFARRYACTMRSPRMCAHTIADEIHKEVFNLDGIARTKLAFVSDRDGERMGGTIEERSIKEIYVADYDGANPIRLTPHRSLNIAPNWSPDNRYLVYTSYQSGFPDIVLHSLYEARPATRPAKGSPQVMNYLAAFSPDGTRIAFASSRNGNFEIYTVRPDGSDLRQLTFHASDDNAPTWSPDGRQIAFTSDRGGVNQLYVMSADGGPVNRLPTGGGKIDRPTWSPAPLNYIAYTHQLAGGAEIRKIDLNTQQVTTLTTGMNGTNESPSVAPNGRHIALTTTQWGKEQIAIIGADGKLERQVTRTGNNRYPSWSHR